ncbi:erythromycin esterase family protein [Streptomyces nanshensis]|uniref:Erythromycin esterase n=1 Tax=Streptomyces nanshensis TaxID=518642 RepID=A0A1E7L287_9ACTN|nr:erythromycin esterase family protein [Streptomyces nanshensis]OEV10306.1 hypothetical protein AN218_18110 [Streptomyces nanshensis]
MTRHPAYAHTDPDEHAAAARWVRTHAHPLAALDPGAPPDDLRPFAESVRDAAVVALAHSMRHSRELSTVSHRVLRLLVDEYGFRSLALEGDDPVRRGLAAYVRDGTGGDPRELLARCRPFWRTEEILDVVTWMRAYNERHPADPVRFAESPVPEPEFTGPESLPDIERHLAESTAWWHEHTGDRIVYWGGLAHMGVDAHRHNAGSRLRERLGSAYAAIGLTFHRGTALHRYPEPPADFAESVLGAGDLDAFTLDLRTGNAPDPAVRAWLAGPVRTRLIGPVYDPAHDAAHHMTADALTDLLNGVIHIREVTNARPLASSSNAGPEAEPRPAPDRERTPS